MGSPYLLYGFVLRLPSSLVLFGAPTSMSAPMSAPAGSSIKFQGIIFSINTEGRKGCSLYKLSLQSKGEGQGNIPKAKG